MKEDLITFETAKVAKEKGFNIPCFDYYNPKYNTTFKGVEYDSDGYIEWDWNNNSTSKIASPYPNVEIKGQCSAPTQSLLQKWLREKHSIHILMNVGMNNGVIQFFYCNVFIFGKNLYKCRFRSKTSIYTYEEALEEGLFEALTLIKL
jgi:hypothetical protein